MRRLPILFILLLPSAAFSGTRAGSALVVKEYEAAAQRWVLQLRAAVDPKAQLAVWKNRPKPAEFGERLWKEIGTELRNEWTVEYCSWLIENAPAFAVEREGREKRSPAQSIMLSLERFHMKSPKIGRLCLALTAFPDPQTLALVEKVSKGNPHEEVQGQAAMAIALLLKTLGDNPDIMRKRLSQLREAIIKAAHAKVGDVTVAELAEDEIYVIQHLTKGREAPDIIGRDVSGVPFKLSALRGKVVVLAFWNSNMRQAEHSIQLLVNLHKQHQGRGMELIGVSADQTQVLRQLKANGTIPWRNFADPDGRIANEYRVQRLPQVYVLDQKGLIQFIGAPGAFVDLAVAALLAGK